MFSDLSNGVIGSAFHIVGAMTEHAHVPVCPEVGSGDREFEGGSCTERRFLLGLYSATMVW